MTGKCRSFLRSHLPTFFCIVRWIFTWEYFRTFYCVKIKPTYYYSTEAVVRRCSVKKMFLEILQNLQENTCTGVSCLIKLQAACSRLHRCFPVNLVKFLRTPWRIGVMGEIGGKRLIPNLACQLSFNLSESSLTHETPKLSSYRNRSIDLICKSIDWFLYDGNFNF